MAAVGMVLTASAQSTDKQMATLQHGDQTQVFYGEHAFMYAYNAAADSGDVITLSSGEFHVPYFLKSVSVYGAGCEDDEVTGTKMTYLNNSINLKPDDRVNGDGETIKAAVSVNGVHLEGLNFNDIYVVNNNDEPLRNLEVVKCKFRSVDYNNVPSYDNVIRQCVITNGINCDNNNTASNLLVSNSHLQYISDHFSTSSSIKVLNCLIRNQTPYSSRSGAHNYTNCVLSGSYVSIPSTGVVSHCILLDGASYSGPLGENNWTGLKNAGVWAAEGEDGNYAEDKDFALKYPDRYIGTDGTEVGLHGGAYPWNKIPSIPRITECTIDTENAANGTIKVSIKAEAQTKE